MTYKTRTCCRLCNGQFKDIINLGDIYLNTFLGVNDNLPEKAPLDMVRCENCGLVQLRDTVDFDSMYSDYWYKSSLNSSMKDALHDVVIKAIGFVELSPGDVVVDIGSNDGTLLDNYTPYLVRVGFEPSNVGKESPELPLPSRVFNTYFNAVDYLHNYTNKAKIITAIAMFYDLEDPHKFVHDIKNILHEDGIFVIQMMDLRSMLENTDFPNLCHEHLEYYSFNVLNKLLLSHGLQVVDFEYNKVNGGSLRVYVKHSQNRPIPIVEDELARERAFFAETDQFEAFRQRIETVKQKVTDIVYALKDIHSSVAVFGASTKGNTTLQYFGLNEHDIDHAAEVNPDKYGRRTVGSNIPIISQDESLAKHPDYYLVLPWGFTDTFIEKHKDYLLSGGRFIVPLPVPLIIGADNEGVWKLPL